MNFLKFHALKQISENCWDTDVWIHRSDEDSNEHWMLRITTLSDLERLDDANDTCFHYDRCFLVKEYDQALLETKIRQLIASCNESVSSVGEACRYLTKYMQYQHAGGYYDPFEQEYYDPYTERTADAMVKLDWNKRPHDGLHEWKKFVLQSVELANGKQYADDCEYAHELVHFIYKEIDGATTCTLNDYATTVGWLKQKLEEEPIIFLDGLFVMRYFDLVLMSNRVSKEIWLCIHCPPLNNSCNYSGM